MDAAKYAVYFRTYFEIEAPDLWWALNKRELTVDSPTDYTLEMSLLPDDDSLPQGFFKFRTAATWTQVLSLPSAVHGLILKINQGPSFSEALQSGLLNTPITEHKSVLTHKWLPKTFFSDIRAIHAELDRAAYKVIDSLFWRLGVHCGPSKLGSDWSLIEYSIDGSTFDSLPFRTDLRGEPYQEPPPKPVPADFGNSLATVKDAPVHHALFREAWKALGAEDRVAIVMGTAAVESAVKHLISELQPETAWLVENVQSPPVTKLLRQYMQLLPGKCTFHNKTLRPPDTVITNINKLIEYRNTIVHSSKCSLPGEGQLKEWLASARDVLWLCDYYCGHEWAAAYISPGVTEALQKEA